MRHLSPNWTYEHTLFPTRLFQSDFERDFETNVHICPAVIWFHVNLFYIFNLLAREVSMDELIKHWEELKLRRKHLTDSWRPGMDDPRSTREVSSSEHKLFPSGLGEHVDGLLCQAASQHADGNHPLRWAGGEKTHLDFQEAAVKDLSKIRHDAR